MTVGNRFYSPIRKWEIPNTVLPMSLTEMARDGAVGNEGIVLWLGRRSNGIAYVTHAVGLRGHGVVKRPDHIHIKPWLINAVTDIADQLNLVAIGQIHSHGWVHGTDLSPVDRLQSIRFPYYLSVVAPDYAQRPDITFQDCGVHVYRPEGHFIRLSPSQIAQSIQVVEVTAVVPDLLVVQ